MGAMAADPGESARLNAADAAGDAGSSMDVEPQPRACKRSRLTSGAVWTLYCPSGRSPAVCATCFGEIIPRSVRARVGSRGSRCHHVACTDLTADALCRTDGWAQLPEAARRACEADLASRVAPQGSASGDTAPQLPVRDECMIGAQADVAEGAVPSDLQHMSFWHSIDWHALHDPVRTGTAVPPQMHFAIAELRSAIGQYILDARVANDEAGQSAGWKAMFFCDRLLFAAPASHRGGRRGQSSESLTKMLSRRVRSAWNGEWSALWQESARSEVVPGSGYARTEAQQLASDIKEIEQAIADNDEQAALRRVDGPMQLASAAVAKRVLPDMFPLPQQSLPALVPREPTLEDVEAFGLAVDETFRKAARRKGYGPGGARNEHWHFMPDFPDHWPPLRECWLLLALGRAPQDVLRGAAAARVLAAAKGDSARPLALGNILRRAVSRSVQRIFQSRVAAVLRPNQYGAGRPGGAEEMYKTIMVDLASRPAACLDSYDVSNAHNALERAAVVRAVRRLLPDLSPWIEPWMHVQTEHVCTLPGSEPLVLPKSRGGDQGDALISLVFPLTFHQVLEDTQAAARHSDPVARVYGYQDDVDLVVTAEARPEARAAFYASCRALGLEPNASKETVYFGPEASRAHGILCTEVQRPVVLRHGGEPTPILLDSDATDGTVQLPADAPEALALVAKRHDLKAKLTKLFSAGLPTQLVLRLLRCRTGGDFTFVARACGLSMVTCAALDAVALETVQHLAGRDGWTEIAARRVFHPVRDGGLGLCSAQLTACAAALGSWCVVAPRIALRLERPSVDALGADVAVVRTCLSAAQQATREASGDPLDPASPSPSTPQAAPTQRSLSRAKLASEVEAVSMLLSADPPAAAAQLSCGGPGAAAWLLRPQKPNHYFSDAQFRCCLRDRLDLPLPVGLGQCQHRKSVPGTSTKTACGKVLDHRGVHAKVCGCSGWSGKRHDGLRDVLCAWAGTHGCTESKETVLPYAAPGLDEARLDAVVRAASAAGRQLIDVTVVTPLTQEMLRHGTSARVAGAAASAAARYKRGKYPLVSMIPFVIEHYGRWGADALALAKRLAPGPDRGRSEALSTLYQDISCALQRANADAIISAAQTYR